MLSLGAFGANNVPKVLRAVEILGMMQARHWRLGSLNEFRKFFKLEPHKTFESINSDPKVAAHLKHLYERMCILLLVRPDLLKWTMIFNKIPYIILTDAHRSRLG
jgi:hypothetical protein